MTTERQPSSIKHFPACFTTRKITAALMASTICIVAGCGSSDAETRSLESSPVAESIPTTTLATDVVDLPTTNVPVSIYTDKVISDTEAASLVGMEEADALREVQARGWRVRVVGRDGELYAVTMDYSAGRLNFTIVNGVVSASTVG